MGNAREINVRKCDVIREIHENFVSRTFPRIRYLCMPKMASSSYSRSNMACMVSQIVLLATALFVEG